MKRVQVLSDGTTVGTTVLVDGDVLPVLRAEVQLRAADVPQIVLVLDGLDVDLHIVTDPATDVCGATHPEVATVRCEEPPHCGQSCACARLERASVRAEWAMSTSS